jgi:hypothetical protein
MLYHVSRNGQNYGPYTLEDLQKYVASGNVLPTDMAKSDDMGEWVPVSQVLGIAPSPVTLAPQAAYPGSVSAYPGTAGRYPDPPNLHWALVLIIGIFTCGIFSIVWMFVQASWMRKVKPASKTLSYYIGAIVVYVISIYSQVQMMILGRTGGAPGTYSTIYIVCTIAYAILFLVGIFTMRSDLEEHFNGPEPIGLSLSGVMTFFFNILYFQYHFSRINELKRIARYGGAAI